jgi:hypothetical protein
MKTIVLSLIIFLLFILCIYLENYSLNENFGCTVNNVDINKCNNNDINNTFQNSVTKLNNMNIYKDTQYNQINNVVNRQLKKNNNYSNTQFNLEYNHHKDLLIDLKKQADDIAKDNIFYNMKQNKDYKSVKSQANLQSLNLIPLSNDKFMISLNGNCLESNSLNHNKVNKCNTNNSNQYFDLQIVSNLDVYKRQVLGQLSTDINDDTIKYPFAVLKSESGNCVGTKDKSLSVGPCINNIKQRWEPSLNPIICSKK